MLAAYSKHLVVLIFVFYLPTVSSCQSRELSRAQAQKMISVSDDFRQISMLDYINRYLKEDKRGTGDARSADEPEAESIQTRIDGYFREEPRVQIAHHLGLVEPHIKRTQFEPARSSIIKTAGFWYFDETWVNTSKGKTLWSDYDLPVQETTVPLARRDLVGITGITKISEMERGVDFSWRWLPNELGKALDPSTAEFKSLPEPMRRALLEGRSSEKRSLTYGWTGERTGRALFRKFDDGWRVERVTF